jgi:hypothetical protein
VAGELGPDERNPLAEHLRECEFCREILDELQALNQCIEQSSMTDLPLAAQRKADELYRAALAAHIIDLKPLTDILSLAAALAADGATGEDAEVRNLATLYAENPEVVLRLMHDRRQERGYLQLISPDPALVANVLVQVPELSWELLTDESGRADMEIDQPRDWNKLNWQVKLPEAVFQLEPLPLPDQADKPGAVTILDNDQGDSIEVSLQSRARSVAVRVLKIRGREVYDNLRVMVSQNQAQSLQPAHPGKAVSFELKQPDATIYIRLFD